MNIGMVPLGVFTMPSNLHTLPTLQQQLPGGSALFCPDRQQQPQQPALGKQPSNAQAILQAIRALAEASEVLQGIDQDDDAGPAAFGSPTLQAGQPGESSMQLQQMRQQVHQQMQTLLALLPGNQPIAANAALTFIADPPGLSGPHQQQQQLQQAPPAFVATLDDSLGLLSAVAPAASCAPIAASCCLGVATSFPGTIWQNPGSGSWQAALHAHPSGPLQLQPPPQQQQLLLLQPHQAPGSAAHLDITALLAPQPSMGSWSSSTSSIGPFVLEAAASGASQLTDATAHYSCSTDAHARSLAATTTGFASASGSWSGTSAALAAAQRRGIGGDSQGWPRHSLPSDARLSFDNNRGLPDGRDRRSSLTTMGEGLPGRFDAQPPPPKPPAAPAPAAARQAAPGKTGGEDGGNGAPIIPAIKGTGMWLQAYVRAAVASQDSVRPAASP